MPVPPPLAPDEVAARLATRAGWSGDTNGISKTFQIGYAAAARMIVDVADESDRVGHHADIDLRWNRLHFAITTHAANGRVTERDFDLADRIDRIAAEHGAVGT